MQVVTSYKHRRQTQTWRIHKNLNFRSASLAKSAKTKCWTTPTNKSTIWFKWILQWISRKSIICNKKLFENWLLLVHKCFFKIILSLFDDVGNSLIIGIQTCIYFYVRPLKLWLKVWPWNVDRYHHALKFGHWCFDSKFGHCMAGRDNGQTLSQNVNGRTLEHDDIMVGILAIKSWTEF